MSHPSSVDPDLGAWKVDDRYIRHSCGTIPFYSCIAIYTSAKPKPYCWMCEATLPRAIMDVAYLKGILPEYRSYGLEIPQQKYKATRKLLEWSRCS